MSLPVTLPIPPSLAQSIRDLPPLPASSGHHVSLTAELVNGELVITGVRRRYLLNELLTGVPHALTEEDREWLDAPPVGKEFGAPD